MRVLRNQRDFTRELLRLGIFLGVRSFLPSDSPSRRDFSPFLVRWWIDRMTYWSSPPFLAFVKYMICDARSTVAAITRRGAKRQ
jgi:hypothetical protein